MPSDADRARAEKLKADGNALFKQQKYDQAITKYQEAIEADPENHVYYSNCCAALSAVGKYEEAVQQARQCVAHKSDFVKGYYRLALNLKHLGKYKEALQEINLGLKRAATGDKGGDDLRKLKNDVQPLADKAEAEDQKKRFAKFGRQAELKAEADVLFKAARFEDAVQRYSEAYEAMPEDARGNELYCKILNNRAACYQQLSDYSNVVADTTAVLEYDENNTKALLRRALAFEGLERYRSALQDVRAVLAINPTVEMALKAQHRIGRTVRLLKQEGSS